MNAKAKSDTSKYLTRAMISQGGGKKSVTVLNEEQEREAQRKYDEAKIDQNWYIDFSARVTK